MRNATVTPAREVWTVQRTLAEVGALLNEHGKPIARGTLELWVRRGLPSHQPSGFKGKRYFYSDEVHAWLNSRCSTDTAGQEVAA